MPSKTSHTSTAPSPPALGTFIDDGALELVEVLGVGGYGVVYRAVDTRASRPKSYAVKCLIHSQNQQSPRQRQLHIREITLHQLASAHPNVVTLHRVIEDPTYTYLVMDFASDGDLFSQILHNCRYLGKDHLIKHVFLQLLDAVEYCHSLGIYHRDLKPENVLCFDGGLRVAITDFGLATTERLSDEFRTGSVYHMSPECFGGEFAPNGSYSPLANDIWSLAVILLNLSTGRNPWKSACLSDPTFQAYLENPAGFLPTVLPISLEINSILTRMLDVDWRQRMSLAEIREAIENVDTFYSEAVVFEGSMARCPWEAGMDIENESDPSTKVEQLEKPAKSDLKSRWSQDSDTEMVFANHSANANIDASSLWSEYSPNSPTWDFGSTDTRSSSFSRHSLRMYPSHTPPSTYSPLSPSGSGSMPVTPNAGDVLFDDASQILSAKSLTIDTNCGRYRYHNTSINTLSTDSSTMHTAVESYADWSSSFFLASPSSRKASLSIPPSIQVEGEGDLGFSGRWDSSLDDISESFYPSIASSRVNSNELKQGLSDTAEPPNAVFWPESRIQHHPIFAPEPQKPHPVFSVLASAPIPIPSKKGHEAKTKASCLFNPIKFFPRTPQVSPIPRPEDGENADSVPLKSFIPSSRPGETFKMTTPPSPKDSCRDASRVRTKRHWFSLFAGTGLV